MRRLRWIHLSKPHCSTPDSSSSVARVSTSCSACNSRCTWCSYTTPFQLPAIAHALRVHARSAPASSLTPKPPSLASMRILKPVAHAAFWIGAPFALKTRTHSKASRSSCTMLSEILGRVASQSPSGLMCWYSSRVKSRAGGSAVPMEMILPATEASCRNVISEGDSRKTRIRSSNASTLSPGT